MNISLAPEAIFYIGSFPVTNSLVAAWITIIFLLVVTLILRSKALKSVPRGLQNVVEVVFEAFLGLIDGVTSDRKQSIKFFPIVVTIFIFILISNWAGLLPGVGSIGIWEVHHGEEVLVPIFRSADSDLNITLALAIISIFTVQFFGIMTIGFFKYAKRFLNFKNPIKFFMGILEIVSEFAKIISLSFRLFGNIFAGEVLLIVISFLIPYVIPLPFMFLELFVGFVQALIFALLTLVFLKFAATELEH